MGRKSPAAGNEVNVQPLRDRLDKARYAKHSRAVKPRFLTYTLGFALKAGKLAG